MKIIKLLSFVLICILFVGCEAQESSTSNNPIYSEVVLIEACAEGFVIYMGYNYSPGMYKRDKNDKLIPCDASKFAKRN